MAGTSRRIVVAVSGDLERPEVVEALFAGSNDCVAIFVESINCAYARIKRLIPDLVVVVMTIDDWAACHLLSMLVTDTDLSGIAVVPLIASEERDTTVRVAAEFGAPAPIGMIGIWMN